MVDPRGRRVCWLSYSKVYHHAQYHIVPMPGERGWAPLKVPCGVTVVSPRVRCQEGTERLAKTLGLRPCRRCCPTQPVFAISEATTAQAGLAMARVAEIVREGLPVSQPSTPRRRRAARSSV